MNSLKNVNDRIRIGDALKVLCRKTCHPGAFCPDAYCDEVWDAFEGVERFKAELESKWIPCHEKLPEEDTEVLVTRKFLGVKDYHYGWNAHLKPTTYVETARLIGKVWVADSDEYKVAPKSHTDPIAWMPLPDPFQEEKK